MSFLVETLKALHGNGVSEDDVVWCGSPDFFFSWPEFESLTKGLTYDKGFGGQEIAKDLLVVGPDWWLERHEYDGSEWWEFKRLPSKPLRNKIPRRLTGCWSTLEEINGSEYED